MLPLFCRWRNSEAKIYHLFWIRAVQRKLWSQMFWLLALRPCFVSLLDQKATVKWERRRARAVLLLFGFCGLPRAEHRPFHSIRVSKAAVSIAQQCSQPMQHTSGCNWYIFTTLQDVFSVCYSPLQLEPVLKRNLRIKNKKPQNKNKTILANATQMHVLEYSQQGSISFP